MFVSYLFQDYSIASKYVEKSRLLQKHMLFSPYRYSVYLIYDGLIALRMTK